MLRFIHQIKVRKLLIGLLALLVVTLACGHALIMSVVWLPAIRAAEKEHAQKSVNLFSAIIEAKTRSMQASTRDYAEWEAMYQYVTDAVDSKTEQELEINDLDHERLSIDGIFVVKESQAIDAISIAEDITESNFERIRTSVNDLLEQGYDNYSFMVIADSNKLSIVTFARPKSNVVADAVSKGVVVQFASMESLLESYGLSLLPPEDWKPNASYYQILADSESTELQWHQNHLSFTEELSVVGTSTGSVNVRLYLPMIMQPLFAAEAPKSFLSALATWLLVCLVVYLFVDKFVLRAFEALARKAKRLADGEWKNQEVVFKPKGTNEAAELAHAINKLCTSQREAYKNAVSLYQQVEANYENYRSVFSKSSNPMLVTYRETIVDFNACAAEAIGDVPEHIIGRNFCELFTVMPMENSHPNNLQNRERKYLLHDRQYLMSCSRIRWGQKECTLHSLTEITELMQLQKSLASAEKMQLIGEFSGGIAHDINNILGAILGYQELLPTIGDLNEEQLNCVRQQELFVNKGSKLVRRLMQFAKNKPVSLIEMELVTVLEDAIALVQAMLPSSIEVTFEAALPHQLMRLDQDDVFQVIMNLCVNASQAMTGRGRIEICLSEEQPTFMKRFSSEALKRKYIWLTVRDNGPGIPQDSLPEIFMPFFTTKRDKGGNGLGLATVKRICEQYGWQIEAFNDGGAVFLIRIIRVQEAPVGGSDLPGGFMWFTNPDIDLSTLKKE